VASGGTKSMVAASSYPNPFATPRRRARSPWQQRKALAPKRPIKFGKTSSEGLGGLPVRLALASSMPTANDRRCEGEDLAHADQWQLLGHTPNNGACLKDANDATKLTSVASNDRQPTARRFRQLLSAGGGTADAPSTFTFTITVGSKSATSQLVFEQCRS
jgi:hypothetical protein